MIDLKRFFINPFGDRQISDDELRTFTEDHLGRLSDRKSTRLNSSHIQKSRMPSSA